MRLLHVAVFSLLSLAFLTAQAPKIKYEQFKLENGLTVLLHQDNSTPIIATSLTYHVGSKNEHPERTGFAHFFEHLMFEGTKHIERGQFFKLVQNAGGELNASTSFDQTNYYLLLPSNQLELALWLESERMLHPVIDSIGIETQRGVIKEEKKQRIDNQPYGSLLEKLFSNAYKVHPYRWTPIGSAQYIDMATYQEFIDFHKMFYTPENAVLAIVGDININDAKKLVNTYFNEIPKGTQAIVRPTEVEPKQTAEIRDTVYDNVQLPLIAQGYKIPAMGTNDYYAISMLSKLFAEGQSSRLYKSLVDEKKVSVFTGAFSFQLESPGLFIIYAVANASAEPKLIEDAITEQIFEVQKNLISEEEFQKLRNQMETEFIQTRSSNLSIAQNLSQYYTFFGDASLINTELEKYMKVTREDIQRVAKLYFNPENRTVLTYLPKQ